MSVLSGGKAVFCDGFGCHATASLPVALRSSPRRDLPSASPETESIAGWLFAGGQENSWHFCPGCIAVYLPQAMNGSLGLITENFCREREDSR